MFFHPPLHEDGQKFSYTSLSFLLKLKAIHDVNDQQQPRVIKLHIWDTAGQGE